MSVGEISGELENTKKIFFEKTRVVKQLCSQGNNFLSIFQYSAFFGFHGSKWCFDIKKRNIATPVFDGFWGLCKLFGFGGYMVLEFSWGIVLEDRFSKFGGDIGFLCVGFVGLSGQKSEKSG